MTEPSYDAYLEAKTAKHLNPQVEFGDWVNDNEDRLLVRFLEHYDGVVDIPQVKDWGEGVTRLWEDFCNKAWEEACDAQPEYEPE